MEGVVPDGAAGAYGDGEEGPDGLVVGEGDGSLGLVRQRRQRLPAPEQDPVLPPPPSLHPLQE